MYTTKNLRCCGVNEIIGITRYTHTPLKLFNYIRKTFNYNDYCWSSVEDEMNKAGRAAYILTLVRSASRQTKTDIYGEYYLFSPEDAEKIITDLNNFITEKDLGTLVVSPPNPNPNKPDISLIQTLIWVPNNPKILEFCRTKIQKPSSVPPFLRTEWWINSPEYENT